MGIQPVVFLQGGPDAAASPRGAGGAQRRNASAVLTEAETDGLMRSALQVHHASARLDDGIYERFRNYHPNIHMHTHTSVQSLSVDVEVSDPVSRAPQMCAFSNALRGGASSYAAYVYGSVALDLWAVEGVRFILFDSLKVRPSPTSVTPEPFLMCAHIAGERQRRERGGARLGPRHRRTDALRERPPALRAAHLAGQPIHFWVLAQGVSERVRQRPPRGAHAHAHTPGRYARDKPPSPAQSMHVARWCGPNGSAAPRRRQT